MSQDTFSSRLLALRNLVKELRRGPSPCPWLSAQGLDTIAPYTLQESYELVECVTQGDKQGLKEEVGDLLYHVLIYLDMLDEQGVGGDEVIGVVHEKLLRRRAPDAKTVEEAKAYWNAMKAAETPSKSQRAPVNLAGLPRNMPALADAQQLSARLVEQGVAINPATAQLQALLDQLDAAGGSATLAGAYLFQLAAWLMHRGILGESVLTRFNQACRELADGGGSPAALSALLGINVRTSSEAE